ncbi:MAG: hypothetical protein IJA91_01755 [Clostridia bacterium]|nr:hypothetical protein [Clostridia bacterium]
MEVGYAAVAGCHGYGMDADVGETPCPSRPAGNLSPARGGVGGCGEYSAFHRVPARLLPVSGAGRGGAVRGDSLV